MPNVTYTVFPGGIATNQYKIADMDETADVDIAGSSGTLHAVEIDNTANAAITYVKLYNDASPTVGTTAPDMILMVPASTKMTFHFPGGVAFSTAFSVAALTAGGTAGTTGPTSTVSGILIIT